MRVALTFDTEHPGRPTVAGTEERILASFAEAGARATFFLQGRWVRSNPKLARRIAEAGHTIGNHSNFHAPMDALSDEWLLRDIGMAEKTIRLTTGVDPRPWFRCPFGSGMEDPRVLQGLEELGYRHVGWDVDSRDWEEGRTIDELEENVVGGVTTRDGDSIVVLHSWPAVTADCLGGLIERLKTAGAEFVAVEEILQ